MKFRIKNLNIKALLGAALVLIGVEAQAYNCSSVSQYVNGNSYNNGSVVKNGNAAYSCTVGGWCSVGGPYEPGAGWAWTNAWSSLGACDAATSSSVRSSVVSSVVASSSKSSTAVSSVIASSSKSSVISSIIASSIKSSIASSIISSVGSCGGISAWTSTASYYKGDKVQRNNIKYEAKWWNQNNDPALNSASDPVWTNLGSCGVVTSSSSSVVSSSKPSSSNSSVSSSLSSSVSSSSSVISSSSSSKSSSSSVVSSIRSSSSSSATGGCVIQALPSGGYSMCKSDLDSAEAAKTSAPIYTSVKASIQTNDNSIVDNINPKASSNPDNVKRVESIVSEATWTYLFPVANTAYNYTRFLRAVGKFKGFCATYTDGRDSNAICRKSLAAMFSHFTQETGAHAPSWTEPEWRQGLYFVRESGCNETGPGCGYNAECPTTGWQTEMWPCGKQTNGEFLKYYGRGAKQLSYHYNYGPFSQAMFGDAKVLLNNPDQVAESWLNVASAVFFFVYPQAPKPSMLHVIDGTWVPNSADQAAGIEPGFGATINVINGGLECNSGSEKPQAVNRIAYYKQFTNYLNVPIGSNEKLGCASMGPFTTAGSGAMLIYWDQDWSYNAANPGGGAFACKQVGYQTAYNALVTGDYQKCVAKYFDVRQVK